MENHNTCLSNAVTNINAATHDLARSCEYSLIRAGTTLAIGATVAGLSVQHAASRFATHSQAPRPRSHGHTDAIDSSAWHDACTRVLEQMGVGVIACDESLRVLAANQQGARLLARFCEAACVGTVLPASIADAARNWLADSRPGLRERPLRLTSPNRSLSVRANFAQPGSSPVFLTISMLRDAVCDDLLREAMRTAWELSARDIRLVMLVREGKSNHEIADELRLTYGTVKAYLHGLFERLEIHRRTELIARVEGLRAGA